jgi:hypothetical protein
MLQKLTAGKVPQEIARPLATELAAAWNAWAAGFQIQIPGAYPTFAAFPGPIAPPTPAMPVGLAQGTSPGEGSLKAAVLTAKLAPLLRRHSKSIREGSPDGAVKDLTGWIESSFQEWKNVVKLVGVMGSGRVATFAPPYVPVGPVVAGDNSSTGPIFAGPRFGKVVL